MPMLDKFLGRSSWGALHKMNHQGLLRLCEVSRGNVEEYKMETLPLYLLFLRQHSLLHQ
jgi:hypothetical protein